VSVVHIAGPMNEGVQRCVRCNAILIDYRNCAVAVMPGDPQPNWSGWKVGEYIHVDGNQSMAVHREACGVHEARCVEPVQ